MQARLLRCGGRVRLPVALELLATCMFQRDQALGVTAVAVAGADLGVVRLVGGDERIPQLARDQRLCHAHGARGVLHPDRRGFVVRVDLQRGVRTRGGRAADHQWQVKALPLHFTGDMAHFFQ